MRFKGFFDCLLLLWTPPLKGKWKFQLVQTVVLRNSTLPPPPLPSSWGVSIRDHKYGGTLLNSVQTWLHKCSVPMWASTANYYEEECLYSATYCAMKTTMLELIGNKSMKGFFVSSYFEFSYHEVLEHRAQQWNIAKTALFFSGYPQFIR